jgi:hypothetical protein
MSLGAVAEAARLRRRKFLRVPRCSSVRLSHGAMILATGAQQACRDTPIARCHALVATQAVIGVQVIASAPAFVSRQAGFRHGWRPIHHHAALHSHEKLNCTDMRSFVLLGCSQRSLPLILHSAALSSRAREGGTTWNRAGITLRLLLVNFAFHRAPARRSRFSSR